MSPDGFEVEWAKANGRTMQQVLDDSWYAIPRYFEDSAAIRKAKLSLTSEQRGYYIDHLANICRENSDGPATSIGKAFFATCEQEAEALGLTLNLWSGGLFEQSC